LFVIAINPGLTYKPRQFISVYPKYYESSDLVKIRNEKNEASVISQTP